jgi:protein-tyrosine phosphatase
MRQADDALPTEELTVEDRTALGWAVSTEHPLGTAIVERVRSGGKGVTATELVTVREEWEQAGRPAPEHHVHRTRVILEDGSSVTGVTFSPNDPHTREEMPSFGLYLDERWSPPWQHAHLEWPDFGVPADIDALRTALLDLLERSRRGESVEVGCLGGHGRTGTALACLAVLAGVPPANAVAWVRANYCRKAVETREQEALVASFSR